MVGSVTALRGWACGRLVERKGDDDMVRTKLARIGGTALLAMVASGCEDDATYPPLDGCEPLMELCINDAHFDDLRGMGVVDVETAETAFRCMLDFYSADCDARVTDILECLGGVSSALACSPCDLAFGEFMHACPPAIPCVM